ncbi:MAG: hypothetical protein IJ727_10815 [Treponema sp.]|nr:hypothetical protein [Treponema sp.]
MKKILLSLVAAIMVASVFLVGCSDLNTSSAESSEDIFTGDYGKYSQIGVDVYAAFCEKFGTAEKARTVLNEIALANNNAAVDEALN